MSRDRMPSISTVMRYVSPEAIAERRRKARENYGRVTPVPANAVLVDDLAAHGESGPPPQERASGPSPWADPKGPKIDVSALPSATAPQGPPEAVEHTAKQRAKRTWIIVGLCVFVGIVGPLSMIALGRTQSTPKGMAPGTRAPASNTATSASSAAQTAAPPALSAESPPPAPASASVPGPVPSPPARPNGKGATSPPRASAAPVAETTAAPSVAPVAPPIPSVAPTAQPTVRPAAPPENDGEIFNQPKPKSP